MGSLQSEQASNLWISVCHCRESICFSRTQTWPPEEGPAAVAHLAPVGVMLAGNAAANLQKNERCLFRKMLALSSLQWNFPSCIFISSRFDKSCYFGLTGQMTFGCTRSIENLFSINIHDSPYRGSYISCLPELGSVVVKSWLCASVSTLLDRTSFADVYERMESFRNWGRGGGRIEVEIILS